MLLWSPIITVLISPLRLISTPICRLISRERKLNLRDNSGVIISSGAMPLRYRYSICLICAAPRPAILPKILLMGSLPNSPHQHTPVCESSAFSYLNFCGLTFFSILSKKVDQVFVWKEETSFLGELWPQRGQVSSA